jgi:predicted dithiol-disulfide oxidoreductase (DUF899 family)
MSDHKTGTHDEWLAARRDLLKAEKELTRRSDELVRQRQELPWVRIEKEYRFDTDEGAASLADLFRGRSQLLVYHFMFGPDYTAGCPACSSIADGFNGSAAHLANHDVMLWAVSRAPVAKLQAYKRRMGWTFPWASSGGTDFNYDFTASITEKQQREGTVEYNYRREPALPESGIGDSLTKRGEGPVAEVAAMTGTDVATYTRERPGMTHSRSRTASSTTPTRPIPAGWTASGACTSGSTGRREGGTRRGSGSAVTTSTAGSDRAELWATDCRMTYDSGPRRDCRPGPPTLAERRHGAPSMLTAACSSAGTAS